MMPARDIPDEVFSGAAKKVVPQGRRLGLVVGIDQYQDPKIPNLTAAVADAKAIYDAMVDPECGLFVPEDTVLLTNELATERNLKREMERIAEVATGKDEVYGPFDAIAWYTANSGDKPHEVGQKQPNAWNLYDMLGNVRQWTADWFDAGY